MDQFPENTREQSPTELHERVHGEVLAPTLLNYASFIPETGGLLDETVFGNLTFDTAPPAQLQRIGECFARPLVHRSEPIASRFGFISLPCSIVHPLIWRCGRSKIVGATGWTEEFLIGLLEGDWVVERETGLEIQSSVAVGPVVTGVAAVTQALRDRPDLLIDRVLVVPPAARPLQAPGSSGTTDINQFYRVVINRKNRLARSMGLGAPNAILDPLQSALFTATTNLFDVLLSTLTPEAVDALNQAPRDEIPVSHLTALRSIEAMGLFVKGWSSSS